LQLLYNNVSKKLVDRNGYVVQYNPLLTAILGCNTNSLLLGSTEQSKGAAFYIGPYINKNKNPLIDSLDIVLESIEHARKYPSTADDTGTDKRFVQYVMTRILNQLNALMEVSDTQAAASLLGLNAGLCSDIFTAYDAYSHMNFVTDEIDATNVREFDSDIDSVTLGSSDTEDCSSTDNDCETETGYSTEDECIETINDNDNISENQVESNQVTITSEITTNSKKSNTNELTYYNSAYGSYPMYKGNGGELIPVPRPMLYRCRGNALRKLNRYEYFTCVEVKRNRKETPKSNSTTGRPNSTQYSFAPNCPIANSYHQILRSKQCTLKLFKNPPPHPGKEPDRSNLTEFEKWQQKANRFALYYLVLFRPEEDMHKMKKCYETSPYHYKWKDFQDFVNTLKEGENNATEKQTIRNACILGEMTDLITSVKTSTHNKAILSNYRSLSRTIWSDQIQAEGRAEYKYSKSNQHNGNEFNNDIDMMVDNMSIGKQLSTQTERNIMQNVAFTDQLINQMKNLLDVSKTNRRNTNNSIDYKVKIQSLDQNLIHTIAEKPVLEENDTTNSNDVLTPVNHTDVATLDERVDKLIADKNLSTDKLTAVRIMYHHFKQVLFRRNDPGNKPPILLITGPPGTGKSWLVNFLTEIALLIGLCAPIKTAFMGIAAINIGGSTICTLLDIPINLSRQYKNEIVPWNTSRLEEFKSQFDLDNTSAIIIDEISMVKPWMLAYIDGRMKEATQCNEPFGGKAVIMLGDFDQQPPVGGTTIPNLAMTLLEKKSKRKYFNQKQQSRQTKKKQFEVESLLTRKGVDLFKTAGLLNLNIQHRCAEDVGHISLLNKMSTGSKITTSDLKPYKTLSSSDLTPEKFLFAPVIVTGNYERHQINAFQAKQWALYNNTHVIRWKRKTNTSSWEGRPNSPRQIEEAEKEMCFWEYYVPKAPAYVTVNINVARGIANGTEVREDSLSFQSRREEQYLSQMIRETPVGNVIDLLNPPTAVNVELYPDFEWDSDDAKQQNAKNRDEWTLTSVESDGRIVIPIVPDSRVDFKKESIRARIGDGIRFRASTMYMADYFPLELGFSFTVPKAQGRTIRKEIVSLSKHPDAKLRFSWEKVYVVLSRIRNHDDMRLLLNMRDRTTLSYISNLEKDKYTSLYFQGFPQEEVCEIRYWNEKLAAIKARFN